MYSWGIFGNFNEKGLKKKGEEKVKKKAKMSQKKQQKR